MGPQTPIVQPVNAAQFGQIPTTRDAKMLLLMVYCKQLNHSQASPQYVLKIPLLSQLTNHSVLKMTLPLKLKPRLLRLFRNSTHWPTKQSRPTPDGTTCQQRTKQPGTRREPKESPLEMKLMPLT